MLHHSFEQVLVENEELGYDGGRLVDLHLGLVRGEGQIIELEPWDRARLEGDEAGREASG